MPMKSFPSLQDDQRYGMVEAISHLVHRDYAEIGGLGVVRKGVTQGGFPEKRAENQGKRQKM